MSAGNIAEKTSKRILTELSGYAGHDIRLFHACLNCFAGPKLDAAKCLLVTLRKNGRMDFREITRIGRI